MGKERVLEEMARHSVDVLILGREGNARYVSGAHRLFLASERAFAPGCVVVLETGQVHLLSNTDFGIPSEIPHSNLYPTSWNPATVVGRIAAIPGVASAARIGVDGLTPLFEALLPAVKLVDGEVIMRSARRLKSTEEVAAIREAAMSATLMMNMADHVIGSGEPDSKVKAVAMDAMAVSGATTAAFEPIITRNGERVTVAVGVLHDGWEADLSRTLPGPVQPDALLAAVDRCRPGTSVADVGADVHGVGLGYEVLLPSDVLEPGMVLSVGVAGARDTVLVTAGDPDNLTGNIRSVG
jgi:Xaa-Pro aminopeptidase